MNHEEITNYVTANRTKPYGVGVTPNKYADSELEFARRRANAKLIEELNEKIYMIHEPRFITPPPTSEFLAAIATLIDARNILELGSLTGYTTLHFIKSIVGKAGAKVVSVDCNPEYDREFFNRPHIKEWVRFIHGWTPGVLDQLKGSMFDLVFIDTDHSIEHTQKELDALQSITRPGTVLAFHDVPEWQTPQNRTPPPIRTWLLEQCDAGKMRGFVLPSCEQQDCLMTFGAGYPKEVNPGIGVFVRR